MHHRGEHPTCSTKTLVPSGIAHLCTTRHRSFLKTSCGNGPPKKYAWTRKHWRTSTPGRKNEKLLYAPPDAAPESTIMVPWMLLLPPPFATFCLSKVTPFRLQCFIQHYIANTDPTPDISLVDCKLCLDWCLVATHKLTAASAQANTSMIALTLQTAPSDDDTFLLWLQQRFAGTLRNKQPRDPRPTRRAPRILHTTTMKPPPQLLPGHPMPLDVWTQMATNITQGFATAAATALQLQPSTGGSAAHEEGGKTMTSFSWLSSRASHTLIGFRTSPKSGP